jgi:tRNA(adenine34) deaminase
LAGGYLIKEKMGYNLIMHKQTDIEYMTEALNQAKKAKELGDLPFGTVIVCDGKIVGRGKCENGTVGDVTDHAEILALREACKTLGRNRLQDCTVYSVLCVQLLFFKQKYQT